MNWQQADDACKTKGGRLPEVYDFSDNLDIMKQRVNAVEAIVFHLKHLCINSVEWSNYNNAFKMIKIHYISGSVQVCVCVCGCLHQPRWTLSAAVRQGGGVPPREHHRLG